MKKRNFLAVILAIIVLLTACGKEASSSQPETQGQPAFALEDYQLQEQGLTGLIELLHPYAQLPEKLMVAHFTGRVDENAQLTGFALTLYGYNENNEMLRSYQFSYEQGEPDVYLSETPAEQLDPHIRFNPNEEIQFVSSQLQRLPLQQQMAQLNFPRYEVRFLGRTKLEPGKPIIQPDENHAFPTVTLEEYESGTAGTANNATRVYFILYDGESLLSENLLYYLCDTAAESTIAGNPDFIMQYDYRVNNGTISFTRDYGETWIDAQLSQQDLEETLSFYRSEYLIPEDSYSITSQPGTIAFLYGESPKLYISKDDGAHWETIDFVTDSFWELPINRRIVHFFDENNGYIALGTDWSMGAGEAKALFITADGGATWQQRELPLNGSSSVLTGLSFANMQYGVVSLKHPYNEERAPTLFYTEDGGQNWTEFAPDWEQMPEEIWQILKIDTLTYENGVFTMVLGQENTMVSFQASSLAGSWQFKEHWKAVVHTVG